MAPRAKGNPDASSIRFATSLLTVQNGAMVSSSKRGLKVSRERHNGVAFVNSTAQCPQEIQISGEEKQRKQQDAPTSAHADIDVQRERWREFTETRHFYGYWDSNQVELPVLKMLPVWASFDLSSSLPDSHKQVLCYALKDAPIEKYAFDDHGVLTWNPLRTKDTMQWLVSCGTRLQTVITLATMFKTFRLGQTSTVELATLLGRLYTRVHERLANAHNDLAYHLDTLYSVVVLALEAAYRGQFFQWDIYMRALQYITKLCGGTLTMSDVARSAVHKADTAGALFSASKPFIPILKRHPHPPLIISEGHCEAISQTLHERLSACGIDGEVIRTNAEIAIFSQNWNEARKKRTVKFEPESLMERFYTLKYNLLLHSEPLRNETSFNTSTTLEDQEDYSAAHSVGNNSNVYPDNLLNKTLEASLRIALLLFLREQAIDPASGIVAYSTLLNRLAQHLRFILLEIRRQRELTAFVDPTPLPGAASVESMRPVLLWICLIADVIQVGSNVFNVDSLDLSSESSIYRAILGDVLGAKANDTRLINEKDWEVCQILDLRKLRGEKWDRCLALQRIMGVVH